MHCYQSERRKKKKTYEWKNAYLIVLALEIEDHRCEWKGRRISQSWVKRSSYLGRTGNSAWWFIQPHYARQKPYRAFFIPPIFRECFWSHSSTVWERERTPPLEISENRPLYFRLPLCRYRGGKNGLEQREKRVSQTERSMPECNTKSKKKIKCFSLLLGSRSCAGLVTLATGSGAEHLIGLRVYKCVCHTQGRSKCSNGKSIRSLLTDKGKADFVFSEKAVLSSFWAVSLFTRAF